MSKHHLLGGGRKGGKTFYRHISIPLCGWLLLLVVFFNHFFIKSFLRFHLFFILRLFCYFVYRGITLIVFLFLFCVVLLLCFASVLLCCVVLCCVVLCCGEVRHTSLILQLLFSLPANDNPMFFCVWFWFCLVLGLVSFVFLKALVFTSSTIFFLLVI